jgi:hypothetical protein
MNAHQGFLRAPQSLLRVAAGTGAADLAAGGVAISAALFLVTVTAMPAVGGRRRAGGRRGAAHARTSGREAENGGNALPPEIPAGTGDPRITGSPRDGRPDPGRRDAEQPWHDVQRPEHADDYPSWPGRPGPYALHPDHPSWGGGQSDPRWDSTEAVLRQDGYPSWPEPAGPPWRDAERSAANDGSGWRGSGVPATGPRPVLPAPVAETDLSPRAGFSSRPSSAAGPGLEPWQASALAGYPPRPAAAPYTQIDSRPAPAPPGNFASGPGSARRADYPPGPGPALGAGYASPGFAPRPGHPPGPGSIPPGSAPRAGFVPRHGPVLQPGATGVMAGVRSEVDRVLNVNRGQSAQGQVWDAGSVELATRIISEANQQAAEIRHEARDDAATARADARQEAAKLVQQAADQAAATLAAAELQATKIRAEILRLSADLGGVATSFTESLLSPAKPAAEPAADPPAKPTTLAVAGAAAPPATEPRAKPAARPGTRSASVPATRPGVSPRRMKPEVREADKPKNRQVSAARKATVAFVALFLAGAATGATEVALHGPAFFVFRANGAGASQTGLTEDQGPGQPNAPGAHHQPKVIPAKATPVQTPPGKAQQPK